MKKTILATAVILMVGLTGAFANNGEEVNQKVAASFSKDFETAKNVQWQRQKDYEKATFSLNNQVLFAYYNENGELLAVIRNILSDNLPISLYSDIRKNYSEFWISDLFEMASEDQTTYYISLEKSDETLILKSVDHNQWVVYKKIKKNII
jgi:hypothetical protein